MTSTSQKRVAIGFVVILTALFVHLIALWKDANFLALFTFAILCLLGGWLTSGSHSTEEEKPSSRRRDVTVSHPTAALSSRLVQPGQPLNAFTIDLEDYFHTEVASRALDPAQWPEMPSRIESSVMRLLDVLEETGSQATVFTLGWVAERYPALLREVARRGHEIACHSFRHQPVFRLTPQQFWEDTLHAKMCIEDAVGSPVHGYRAPNFSITPGTEWAFDILSELGFRYDSSVHPVWHKLYSNPTAPRFPYRIPNTGLLEIPVSTLRVAGKNLPVAGGAYLRLLPFLYTYYGLKHLIEQEGQPVTLYIHPWELDYLQPVVNPEWKSRIRQTWGTDTLEQKLRRLLQEWRFASISQVFAEPVSALPSTFVEARRKPELLQVG
jgi:polysaccharide deacetylase family protein (PEP-CTERM system associated)